MGNDQQIYIINNRKCGKDNVHSFSAKNDDVIQLSDSQVEFNQDFNWDDPKHEKAFRKAGLTLDMFEDSKECATMHLSLIKCESCGDILAIVTHCY